ncbi:MAG TPA: VOC family protein [Candidatus Levybacteria bacterium]|nr:VOC family protein [Candidatus Levybacteria bacterium]
MNKVVHFEIPFDDKQRSQKFYADTFGWKFDEMPEVGYIGAMTTPTSEDMMPTEPGSINGGFYERTKENPTPVITIEVESIDDHAKKIEAAGGLMIVPKGEVPNMGYYAYFKDTEGNTIGLWENM